MNWKGPTKSISVRLPEDLHVAVKSAAPSRAGTVEKAYTEALDAWLERKAVPERSPLDAARSHWTADQEEAHRLLEYVLQQGSPDQAQWITGNLKTFEEAIRSRPGKSGSRRKAG